MPEILAPAGSREALTAAVRAGADAVYFGGKAFNARRNASNFDTEESARAIEYCHGHGVKVYVTLNTLAADRELKEAVREIEDFCLAGADAFIVQDLGLAALIKQVCPSAVLHASTQMSVQTAEGIEFLKRYGFTRAVLPRELSEKEIRYISSHTDMELEAFVHGAHCMCLSGQCLMSSVLGGRSGNRGLCAQPCRLPFGVNGKGGNNLSLKDMSLIGRIPELVDAGISSLKIEGRMKRPEYVAAAVRACRNAVSGRTEPAVTDALGAVFSRSGFTSGYFDGRTGREMFGVRTKEDVTGAGPALDYLKHIYDNENPLIPVKAYFEMPAGRPALFTVSSGEFTGTAESEIIPSPAINKAVTDRDARERLSKCGGTQFYVEDFVCSIDEGLNMPVSALNALRRDALADLENKMAYREKPEIKAFDFSVKAHVPVKPALHIRFFDCSLIPENFRADRVIIPLDADEETVRKLSENCGEIAAEIPVNVFSEGKKYLENLLRLKALGVTTAWACGLDGAALAEKAGMKYAGGFGMNIFNSLSLTEIEKAGVSDCLLSCEMSTGDISRLGDGIPAGVMVYGRIPLMVTRNCPVRNKLSCRECGGNSELVDRMGVHFPVKCGNGCSYILNSRPLCMYDRLSEIERADYHLLYFTIESKEECAEIINGYLHRSSPSYEFTRGLYHKNVL